MYQLLLEPNSIPNPIPTPTYAPEPSSEPELYNTTPTPKPSFESAFIILEILKTPKIVFKTFVPSSIVGKTLLLTKDVLQQFLHVFQLN